MAARGTRLAAGAALVAIAMLASWSATSFLAPGSSAVSAGSGLAASSARGPRGSERAERVAMRFFQEEKKAPVKVKPTTAEIIMGDIGRLPWVSITSTGVVLLFIKFCLDQM
mmetsp:Transcript_12038/g.31873  ORF Transcript_12038/g.31873 Transcript_12038/m.31873 type:complete len:112 (-) Transcript_12038:199-534(-)